MGDFYRDFDNRTFDNGDDFVNFGVDYGNDDDGNSGFDVDTHQTAAFIENLAPNKPCPPLQQPNRRFQRRGNTKQQEQHYLRPTSEQHLFEGQAIYKRHPFAPHNYQQDDIMAKPSRRRATNKTVSIEAPPTGTRTRQATANLVDNPGELGEITNPTLKDNPCFVRPPANLDTDDFENNEINILGHTYVMADTTEGLVNDVGVLANTVIAYIKTKRRMATELKGKDAEIKKLLAEIEELQKSKEQLFVIHNKSGGSYNQEELAQIDKLVRSRVMRFAPFLNVSARLVPSKLPIINFQLPITPLTLAHVFLPTGPKKRKRGHRVCLRFDVPR